jgi:hypothetical protein
VADVPGNHLELIDSRAGTTAGAIRAWIARLRTVSLA